MAGVVNVANHIIPCSVAGTNQRRILHFVLTSTVCAHYKIINCAVCTQHKIIMLTVCTHYEIINLQALCFLYVGQAFGYSPENTFYIFNQQIYFII